MAPSRDIYDEIADVGNECKRNKLRVSNLAKNVAALQRQYSLAKVGYLRSSLYDKIKHAKNHWRLAANAQNQCEAKLRYLERELERSWGPLLREYGGNVADVFKYTIRTRNKPLNIYSPNLSQAYGFYATERREAARAKQQETHRRNIMAQDMARILATPPTQPGLIDRTYETTGFTPPTTQQRYDTLLRKMNTPRYLRLRRVMDNVFSKLVASNKAWHKGVKKHRARRVIRKAARGALLHRRRMKQINSQQHASGEELAAINARLRARYGRKRPAVVNPYRRQTRPRLIGGYDILEGNRPDRSPPDESGLYYGR